MSDQFFQFYIDRSHLENGHTFPVEVSWSCSNCGKSAVASYLGPAPSETAANAVTRSHAHWSPECEEMKIESLKERLVSWRGTF